MADFRAMDSPEPTKKRVPKEVIHVRRGIRGRFERRRIMAKEKNLINVLLALRAGIWSSHARSRDRSEREYKNQLHHLIWRVFVWERHVLDES